jgi:hypothetical protein
MSDKLSVKATESLSQKYRVQYLRTVQYNRIPLLSSLQISHRLGPRKTSNKKQVLFHANPASRALQKQFPFQASTREVPRNNRRSRTRSMSAKPAGSPHPEFRGDLHAGLVSSGVTK